MTPNRRDGDTDRLYQRGGRWWGDFRDFGDVLRDDEKPRQPLRRAGDQFATQDKRIAERILMRRLDEYRQRRKGWVAETDPTLAEYSLHHLKAKGLTVAPRTLARDKRAFKNLTRLLGMDTNLSAISPRTLTDYWHTRRNEDGYRGRKVSDLTVRAELIALSNMYERAITEEAAEKNPVSRMHDRPKRTKGEAEWLEVGEVARLIQAADDYATRPTSRMRPYFPALLATYLYTGGRRGEVFGLERGDIDFASGVVYFRANRWRSLKTDNARRTVPLWPDLRRILSRHLFGQLGPPRTWRKELAGTEHDLLFPSDLPPHEGKLLKNVDGMLAKCVEVAGIDKRVTLHTLRHTYTATRLQTLDHGAPVSAYTVARELGHANVALIEKTYGHLQRVRDRSEHVQYVEADVLDIASRRDEKAG